MWASWLEALYEKGSILAKTIYPGTSEEAIKSWFGFCGVFYKTAGFGFQKVFLEQKKQQQQGNVLD